MGRYGCSARAWQACADFYRDLSKIGGWSQQRAMVEFVERIAPAAVAREISGGTSHQMLIIEKFSAPFGAPYVVVWCWGTDARCARFTIRWRHRPDAPIKEEIVDSIDDPLWQRIVSWLEQRGQTAARPA